MCILIVSKGPDSPHFRTLVPKTIPDMGFGTTAVNGDYLDPLDIQMYVQCVCSCIEGYIDTNANLDYAYADVYSRFYTYVDAYMYM